LGVLKENQGQALWHLSAIPTIWEAEIGRIKVQGQHEPKKVSKIPSQPISWAWLVCICNPSYIGGTLSKLAWVKKSRLWMKNKESNKDWGCGSSGGLPA
jgi:hypothetical protein